MEGEADDDHKRIVYDVTLENGRQSTVTAHRVVVSESGALMFGEDGWTRLAAPGFWRTVVRRGGADEEGEGATSQGWGATSQG